MHRNRPLSVVLLAVLSVGLAPGIFAQPLPSLEAAGVAEEDTRSGAIDAPAYEGLKAGIEALTREIQAIKDALVVSASAAQEMARKSEEATSADTRNAQEIQDVASGLLAVRKILDGLLVEQERHCNDFSQAQADLTARAERHQEQMTTVADGLKTLGNRLDVQEANRTEFEREYQEQQKAWAEHVDRFQGEIDSARSELKQLANTQESRFDEMARRQEQLWDTYLTWIAAALAATAIFSVLCNTALCLVVLRQRRDKPAALPILEPVPQSTPATVPAVQLPNADTDCVIDGELWKNIVKHLKQFPRTEQGGFGLGFRYNGQSLLVGVVLPQQVNSTGVHCEFNVEDIEIVRAALDEVTGLEECVLVAWVHTHPGLGVFLSETDRDTIKNWSGLDRKARFLVIDPTLNGFEKQVGAFDAECSHVTISRAQCLLPPKAQAAFQGAVQRAYRLRGKRPPTVLMGTGHNAIEEQIVNVVCQELESQHIALNASIRSSIANAIKKCLGEAA